MKSRRTITAATAALMLAVGIGVGAPAAQASSGPHVQAHVSHVTHAAAPTGTRSLAAVLAADRSGFDRNPGDFDILTAAVTAVLAAKPSSPVSVLANGNVALTAFLPTDGAFRLLAHDLTHHWYGSERRVFAALASGVGVDGIEQVLLYHVVPGVTIDARTALASDGAVLTTAQGGTIRVDVLCRPLRLVQLVDKDPNAANPYLIPWKLDINKGNKQIAHAITRVLRPADL